MASNANKLFTINITFGTLFKALLVVLLVFATYALRDLLLALLVAIVAASAVEPAIKWGISYRVPRGVMTFIIYLLILGVLLGVVPVLASSMLGDMAEFLTVVLPKNLSNLSAENAGSVWSSLQAFGSNFSSGELLAEVRGALASVQGGIISAASYIFGGVFSFFLIFIFAFYLSAQERGVENFLRLITPIRHEAYLVDLWHRSQQKIGLWMRGQLLLAVLIGILVYLGLVILGVRYALTLALLALILDIIPYFGPIVSSIPAMMISLADGGWTLVLMVAGLYLIVNQFEAYLFQPLVVKKATGVSPMVIILALFIGAQLAGFIGIILAAPLAAVFQELITDLEKERRRPVKVKANA